jgi:peptide subunit release factor 1 (eRF1)
MLLGICIPPGQRQIDNQHETKNERYEKRENREQRQFHENNKLSLWAEIPRALDFTQDPTAGRVVMNLTDQLSQ